MIQRIQSLYIFLSIILVACSTFMPLMDIFSAGSDFIFRASGISSSENILLSTTPLLILFAAILLIDLVTLFSFKKRWFQVRLLTFSIILKLGTYGLGGYYLFQINGENDFAMTANVSVVFPIIATILSSLAMRAVIKDEALIKSLDRIR